MFGPDEEVRLEIPVDSSKIIGGSANIWPRESWDVEIAHASIVNEDGRYYVKAYVKGNRAELKFLISCVVLWN